MLLFCCRESKYPNALMAGAWDRIWSLHRVGKGTYYKNVNLLAMWLYTVPIWYYIVKYIL